MPYAEIVSGNVQISSSRLKRRYPRFDWDMPAEMGVSVTSKRFGRKKVAVPVSIKSIAPHGLGLATIGTVGLDLTRGRNIRVKFAVDNEEIEIPAWIAWSRQLPSEERRIDLGIRLLLGVAPATFRHHYAEWFVARFRSEAGLPPAAPL